MYMYVYVYIYIYMIYTPTVANLARNNGNKCESWDSSHI